MEKQKDTITGFDSVDHYAYFQMAFGGLLQDAQATGKVSGEEVTRFWNWLELADREQRLLGYAGFVVGCRKS